LSTFARLLPTTVECAEERGQPTETGLLEEEARAVAHAVEKRRREFATARRCARRAMSRLGIPRLPILPGEGGAPTWPPGLVGSMTHCHHYSAAAVARNTDIAALGIDAEPHEALPDGVIDLIALPSEKEGVAALLEQRPLVRWDRLLFCAKEAVYKTWFPLARCWLGFHDVRLTVDPDAGTFHALLPGPGLCIDSQDRGALTGSWQVSGGLIRAALAVPVRQPHLVT
jgi:4'-phosphopantetheinyl transferase EntD